MKKNNSNDLLNSKEKRHKLLITIIVPIIVVMLVLGFLVFKQAKSMLALLSESASGEVAESHRIESMNFVLRDNATKLQEELFSELKELIASDASEEDIAASIAKNHVADFYTWSNKRAQYDVGGLYYVNAEGRNLVFTEARDTIYKYLNNYIDEYGADNLLEVETVDATVKKAKDTFGLVRTLRREYEADYDDQTMYEMYQETTDYEAWDVTCTWTYKQGGSFSTSKFPTKCMFKVINNTDDGRMEIVMAGDNLDLGGLDNE